MFVEILDGEITVEDEAIDWTHPVHDFVKDCAAVSAMCSAKCPAGVTCNCDCTFALREIVGKAKRNFTIPSTELNYTDVSTYKHIPTNTTRKDFLLLLTMLRCHIFNWIILYLKY